MSFIYVALESRSHAFVLEHRLKCEEIECEITYMPRQLMTDLCNMGLRFPESQYDRTVNALRRSGIPGLKLYREVLACDGASYVQLQI